MVSDQHKPKIVLVEDDAIVSETLSVALTKAGFDVLRDQDGKQAFELVQREQPSIVLLDIRLSDDIDGLDILRSLKQDEKTKGIPVLMLTNLTDQRLVTDSVEMGARGYFIKSEMSYDDVVKKVKEIVG